MARNLSHYLLDKKKENIEDSIKNILDNFFKNFSKVLTENVIGDFKIFEITN
jgi:hypothetical protein